LPVFFVPKILRFILKKKNNYLICPIRGELKIKKYDSKGILSEEYQRIKLIKHLILKKGFKKKNIFVEYHIPIGSKGKNSLRVDLVVKNQKKFLLVAEIKKTYRKSEMESAIEHQLIPAMILLNSEYGMYFDNRKKIIIKNPRFIKNERGELGTKTFDIKNYQDKMKI
jgi:hypothetical protein